MTRHQTSMETIDIVHVIYDIYAQLLLHSPSDHIYRVLVLPWRKGPACSAAHSEIFRVASKLIDFLESLTYREESLRL
jgi:hypothetical protein